MRRDGSRIERARLRVKAVIGESCYLLRNLSGAPEVVIENIAAGIFQLPFQRCRKASDRKCLEQESSVIRKSRSQAS